MKIFVQVFIAFLLGINFLVAQASSGLNADYLEMLGDNGGETVKLQGNNGTGNNEYGAFWLKRTTSGTDGDTNVYLSADHNDAGLLTLGSSSSSTNGATLYGDYNSDNSIQNNHGHLFLKAYTLSTTGIDSPFQPLIRFDNIAKDQEWDIGVYNAKVDLGLVGSLDLGTRIAYQYNGSTVATISRDGTWNQISDKKLKTNIKALDSVVEKIQKLTPSNYEMKATPGVTTYGFIAQNLAEQFPELVSRIQSEKEDRHLVNYTGMIPILTKAIQEQTITIKEKEEETAKLRKQVDQLAEQLSKVDNLAAILAKAERLETKLQTIGEMEERLYQMEHSLQSCCMNASTSKVENGIEIEIDKTNVDFPKLEQNQPNPFNTETTIQYYLPSNINRAQMVLTNSNGQVLKTFQLKGTGFGRVIVEANAMPAGNFNYSLVIDGKVIQSKRMVLTQ